MSPRRRRPRLHPDQVVPGGRPPQRHMVPPAVHAEHAPPKTIPPPPKRRTPPGGHVVHAPLSRPPMPSGTPGPPGGTAGDLWKHITPNLAVADFTIRVIRGAAYMRQHSSRAVSSVTTKRSMF